MSLTIAGALRALDQPRHRGELYRAWATANSAGLSHQAALEGMSPSPDADVEALRRALIVGTAQQKSVAVVVKTHPALLPPFEAATLVAADEAQALGPALALLADWHTRESKRHMRVRLMLGYPIFFGIVASFVVPIPVLYRSGRGAYLGAIAAALVLFVLVGGLVLDPLARAELARRRLALLRFARALATLIACGVPRGRAVRLAADASASGELVRHLAPRSDRELQTMPLADLLRDCRAVSAALLSQLAVADATGDYLHTMRRYAEMVEAEEQPR